MRARVPTSASLRARLFDQQVGGAIECVELRIEIANVRRIHSLAEGRGKVPDGSMGVDLQHMELPVLEVPDNIDPNHRAFGKRLVGEFAKRNDIPIIAD
jgi:hypothetical protein